MSDTRCFVILTLNIALRPIKSSRGLADLVTSALFFYLPCKKDTNPLHDPFPPKMSWSPQVETGDGGYEAYRFHKRYYAITTTSYSMFDVVASGQNLGTWLISQIPYSHSEYLSWLAAQRSHLSERKKHWEEHLAVKPSATKPANELVSRTHQEEIAPSWFIPLHAEWVFIMDLDCQTLSVGDGLQFGLEDLPHIDWRGVINIRRKAAKVGLLHELFPGRPREATKPFADGREQVKASMCDEKQPENPAMNTGDSQHATRRTVTPRCLADIPWRCRHGPILRLLLFSVWSSYVEIPLVTTLPQWNVEDTPFQEIVFTILCLAAGGKHVQALSTASLMRTAFDYHKVHALVSSEGVQERQPELMSLEMSGSFLADGSPAFPAGQMVYWFDNVLVVLATRLGESRAVDDGVDRVVRYCRQYCPASCVDVVLMSIQHIVLIRVLANGDVEHSALLPLFDITENLTSGLEDCYRGPGLEPQLHDEGTNSMEREKIEPHDISRTNEPSIQNYRFRVKGKDSSTFCALIHILDAAARRRMSPLARGREGIFPAEIYIQILAHITDPQTRASCLDVCRTFRDYCQAHVLFSAGVVLKPCRDVQTCTQPGHNPKSGFTLSYNSSSEGGAEEMTTNVQVDFESIRIAEGSECSYLDGAAPSWTIAVGVGQNRKILLNDLQFRFTRNSDWVRQAGAAFTGTCLECIRHLVARDRGGDPHECRVPGCYAEFLDQSNLWSHYRTGHMTGDAPYSRNSPIWLSVERAKELGLGQFDTRGRTT